MVTLEQRQGTIMDNNDTRLEREHERETFRRRAWLSRPAMLRQLAVCHEDLELAAGRLDALCRLDPPHDVAAAYIRLTRLLVDLQNLVLDATRAQAGNEGFDHPSYSGREHQADTVAKQDQS